MQYIPLFEVLNGDQQHYPISALELGKWIRNGNPLYWSAKFQTSVANESQREEVVERLWLHYQMTTELYNMDGRAQYLNDWRLIYENPLDRLVIALIATEDYKQLLSLIDADFDNSSTVPSTKKSDLSENAQKAANARHKDSREIRDALLLLLIQHRDEKNIRAAELLRPEIRQLMGKKENDKGPTVETIAKWIGAEKAKAKEEMKKEAKEKAKR